MVRDGVHFVIFKILPTFKMYPIPYYFCICHGYRSAWKQLPMYMRVCEQIWLGKLKAVAIKMEVPYSLGFHILTK